MAWASFDSAKARIGMLAALISVSLSAVAVLLSSACASTDQKNVKQAVTAPLADLNLLQVEIPPILQVAQTAPYRLPEPVTCQAVFAEVTELDDVLGPDVDATPEQKQSWYERGKGEAKNVAIGALRSTTEGLLPFRGWARKLSGAERQSNKVRQAIRAGNLRRSFIKGWALAAGCYQPAVTDHDRASTEEQG